MGVASSSYVPTTSDDFIEKIESSMVVSTTTPVSIVRANSELSILCLPRNALCLHGRSWAIAIQHLIERTF